MVSDKYEEYTRQIGIQMPKSFELRLTDDEWQYRDWEDLQPTR